MERFLKREKELERNDLILPVYYIDTPLLNDEAKRAKDNLAEVIAERQYADWRELRFEPFTSPIVGKTLAQLATQIRDALERSGDLRKPQENRSTVSQSIPVQNQRVSESSETTQRPTTKNEPPTIIVDQLHRGDYLTITEAINKAKPGDRILIRPGLYKEGIVINKPLEIIGEGESGDVIIEAVEKTTLLFQTTMSRVSNLTLRQMGGVNYYCINIAQGRLELEGCDITSQSFACIGIHNGADPRLRRNRIHDGKQSGVYVYENGQGTLEDNEIFNNTLHGLSVKAGGNPTLRRNRIYYNKQTGVYVYENGQGTLEDNEVFGNTLNGVSIKIGGNPTLRRNRIYNNRQNGVHVYENGQGTLEDNDIFGNGMAGVFVRENSDPVVRHNRINKNAHQGIWVSEEGTGTFEDNDLRDNVKGAWSISKDSESKVKRARNQE